MFFMYVPPMDIESMRKFIMQNENALPDYFIKYAILSVIFLEDHPEKIKLLLEYHCDFNTPDMYNYTPLYYAILKNQKAVVKILLEHGAELKEDMKEIIENSDEEMKEILYFGWEHNNIKEPLSSC